MIVHWPPTPDALAFRETYGISLEQWAREFTEQCAEPWLLYCKGWYKHMRIDRTFGKPVLPMLLSGDLAGAARAISARETFSADDYMFLAGTPGPRC